MEKDGSQTHSSFYCLFHSIEPALGCHPTLQPKRGTPLPSRFETQPSRSSRSSRVFCVIMGFGFHNGCMGSVSLSKKSRQSTPHIKAFPCIPKSRFLRFQGFHELDCLLVVLWLSLHLFKAFDSTASGRRILVLDVLELKTSRRI